MCFLKGKVFNFGNFGKKKSLTLEISLILGILETAVGTYCILSEKHLLISIYFLIISAFIYDLLLAKFCVLCNGRIGVYFISYECSAVPIPCVVKIFFLSLNCLGIFVKTYTSESTF